MDASQRRTILEDLLRPETFEKALHRYFVGQKRFSLEGSESVVPALQYRQTFARDVVRAAVGGGAEGVRLQMSYLHLMLGRAMVMTGCPKLADISERILV